MATTRCRVNAMSELGPEERREVLGYWFRYGRSSGTLHLTRFEKDAEGQLHYVTACGGLVREPDAPVDVTQLSLAPTTSHALNTMDDNQRNDLCQLCLARVQPKHLPRFTT